MTMTIGRFGDCALADRCVLGERCALLRGCRERRAQQILTDSTTDQEDPR